MEIHGRYKIKTIDGHKPDECKSAMQKYARRGISNKMYYAVQQLNNFINYNESDRQMKLPTIKAIRTNMINRLSIILFEDVSYKEISVFERVCYLINMWKLSRTEDLDGDDGSTILKEICAYISSAKKARQPSYLRNYYGYRTIKADKMDFERMMYRPNSLFDTSFSWIYQNEIEAYEWLKNYHVCDKLIPLVKYSLNEWKRLKGSPRKSDRLIFLVVPLLWIKYGWNKFELPVINTPTIERLDKFDDFVYDMHTNRGGTKTMFITDGSVVTNEDPSAIDVHMKRLYMLQRIPTRTIFIPVFTSVKMITDGLCGGKLPCFHAVFKGEKKIIKPFSERLNFGLDYAYVDAQKQYFNIPALNIKLVEIPGHAIIKYDNEFKLITNSECRQVFAVMDEIIHKGDLGKNKQLLDDELNYDEMLKIRCVNGIFRTSDNILRNILVRSDNVFVPIDENDILGKRDLIFNKLEPIKQSKYWSKERIIKIIKSLNIGKWKTIILNNLTDYGLENKFAELSSRMDSYEEIVLQEL